MNIENNSLNITDISIGKLTDTLSAFYVNAAENGTPLKEIPAVMLWGPAGVGKSQGITQISEKLESETHKHVTVTDIRLLLFSPVDLRGVPVADANREFTNWLRPRIFDLADEESVINIIFLDELSAAPQSIQAAAYQICLDRKIGEHVLPDNCIVIAAGNRATDHSVSYKMPVALANRMLHFNVVSNYDSWRIWAIRHGIDERVLGYLSFDNSKLCTEAVGGSLAFATPRSWSFVSTILKTNHSTPRESHELISAAIGTDTAIEFEAWCEVYRTLPSVGNIVSGKCTTFPKTGDALFALISSLTVYVSEHRTSISVTELDNIYTYACRFPVDFATMFHKNITAVNGISLKLMKSQAAKAWAATTHYGRV